MGSKFMASAYNRFGEPNPKATKYKSGGSVKRDYRDEKEVETVETVLENTKIVPVPQQNIGLMAAQYFGVRSALSQEDGVTVTATYFPYYDRYGNLSGFKKRDWTIPKEQRAISPLLAS
ncbi:primase [Salmonella phage 40] [Escherichia phage vB_Eco_Alma]|nr:primase [Salmonella phage 40] [Escherichia phage vB_Eco_Alma]